MNRLFTWIALFCFGMSAVGCSNPNPVGTVKGTATVKGKPYNKAAVMFVSLETGHGASGDLDDQGNYQLSDPIPVGQYTVYFAPKSIAPEDATAAPLPMHMDKAVPDKYWSESSSDIKVDVKEGSNDIPVEIK
ncbi:hypothetical protein VN12_10230 [Pirellula sp. SH-Sr6A]|uniref:carboxypeptidase regulatory-like domain-containing protein n=1 Tax=Pirellula sp. SH-Sr6A TaxID=1632865 RepID=UPI00078DCA4C|nr:carboxypeptidase regulatory-like domain-containing protein [Pirellula sp. SH-Sr6A]AMV32492.1 hypothetical protein VN12_10230 [Pirellula sp. SH-Sr6A]